MHTEKEVLPSLVTALAGSSGHAAAAVPAGDAESLAALVLLARNRVRTAQVELYSDHEHAALLAVRAAQKSLPGGLEDATVNGYLNEASWHLLHHRTHEAADALDHAHAALPPAA